jgi:hypothetical protein
MNPALRLATFVLLSALPFLTAVVASGQVPPGQTVWEARPKLVSAVDLLPRTRLETWIEFQEGLDFSFHRWRTGGLIDRRLKPFLNLRLRDIDEDSNHFLAVAAGHEYLHTIDQGSLTIENRIIAQATPHIVLSGITLANRNRTEFRWVNGVSSFRYRNRLTVIRQSQAGTFRFAPYAYGELFYNSTPHSWNQREYAAGVQFPYKSRLMLDTYWLHENCTSCSHGSENMIGVTFNLYLRQIE